MTKKRKKNNKNILLGVCGSIAAYKVCELIRTLKKRGFDVRCILTEAGKEFITPLTLQTLSGNQVYTDMFAPYFCDPGHISLAEYAGLVAVVPATADIIAKMACGIADELLTGVVLSTRAKILVCPAMHTCMWENPVTRGNVQKLRKAGYSFIGPVKGELTRGKGTGRMAGVEEIAGEISKLAGKR